MRKQEYVLEFETFAELKEKATALVMSLGGFEQVNPPETIEANEVKKTRKKANKAEESVEVESSQKAPAPAPPPEAKATPTLDSIKEMLVKVQSKVDFETAKKILNKVGAAKLAEVKPEQYEQVFSLCEEALTN